MPAPSKRFWIVPAVLSLLVAALWVFPAIWYTKEGSQQKMWFTERTAIDSWEYLETPVGESAEKLLVADRTFNGDFRKGGDVVRVFSARRYEEKSNEIGLFVHTPDRCWVEGGWQMEPIVPDVAKVSLHGVQLAMERRLFHFRGQRELVYFCGLVGGQPLPYRLDHNLSVGMRTALKTNAAAAGTAARLSDTHFWKRLWTSFMSRHAINGPKQFIRISTSVKGDDVAGADERLRQFIGQWLVPGDYDRERADYRAVVRR